MNFREDINGLRAVAVIAVVLFHFSPELIPGGFAGVDVFFVISGYLMTRIIFRGLEEKRFSITNFYITRANRIVPPLGALCVVLLLLGWFYLTPLDYKTLTEHVAASINFLSNFIYWSEAGYFDTESREKWLLHTWSLSVEWQFYLIYPLVLVGLARIMPIAALKQAVLVITALGILFCVIATYKWPSASYYLLPARLWELTIGGVAFLYPLDLTNRARKAAGTTGLLFILASYLFISEDTAWPGYLALFPVVGAFLVIQAQQRSGLLSKNRALQSLGSWSYSIYLWHWPLVVVFYAFNLDVEYILGGVVLSVLLGFLSYRYVERINFRAHYPSFLSSFASKPALTIIGITALSVMIMSNSEFTRNADLLKYMDKVKHQLYCHVDNSYTADDLDCRLGAKANTPVGLLWGDSFAGALDPFVINLLDDGEQSFVSRTTSRCIPVLSETEMLGHLPEYCALVRKTNREQIAQKQFDVIFLAGRWDGMYQAYGDEGITAVVNAVNYSAQHAKTVYFFDQPVFYKHKVANIFLRTKISSLYPHKYVRDDELAQQVNRQLREAITNRQLANVYFVDRDVLYGSKVHPDLTPAGLPYIYDRGHLTDVGSIQASENFKQSSLFARFSDTLSN